MFITYETNKRPLKLWLFLPQNLVDVSDRNKMKQKKIPFGELETSNMKRGMKGGCRK